MAYTSWSVVDFEQPTTSKWNIIGEDLAWFDSMLKKSGSHVGLGGVTPTVGLDVLLDDGSVKLTNNNTDNTNKVFRILLPHYQNAEEAIEFFGAYNDNSINQLLIGGGNSLFNAATVIQFFTAGNPTTVSGTERARIEASGNFGIGTTTPSARLHVAGDTTTEIKVTGSASGQLTLDDTNGGVNTSKVAIVGDDGQFLFNLLNDDFTTKTLAAFINTEGGLFANVFIGFIEQSATPTSPSDGASTRMYMKSDRIIFVFNDSGTVRYKSLLLSGTGVTWSHSTSAP